MKLTTLAQLLSFAPPFLIFPKASLGSTAPAQMPGFRYGNECGGLPLDNVWRKCRITCGTKEESG
jgi:hypothetical protein